MWGKIAVGTRCYAQPEPEFFVSFVGLMRDGLRSGDKVLDPVIRWNVVTALKMMLDRFLATDCDSLLVLEDDTVFRSADLEALRASGGEYGILSALFAARRFPFNPQVFRSVMRSKNSVDDLRGVIDVEAVPFGFCLIRRAVVEAIQKRNKARPVRWGAADECFSYCEDARVVGCRVGMNTGVSIGHLTPGVKVYWNAETGKPEMDNDNIGK